MPDRPDLRSSKMESSEGRGIARGRWVRWWSSVPADVLRAIGDEDGLDRVDPRESPPSYLSKNHAAEMRQRSELIGFWIAWHSAGGFHALEWSGWNRATIYRKLRLFRTEFGNHPDEHRFEWIKLDLTRCWNAGVLQELGVEPTPKSKAKK